MVYNPATDFLALWRNTAGQLSKMEMPGLDYVVSALARAGLITVSVSATAPVVGQATTAWLQTAVPSYSAEGVMRLWNPATNAYAAATPALLFKMLETAAGENGVSWYSSAGGPPANTVGQNGDYAIRIDEPGGIYGPKTAGAWPAAPLPGTTDIISSAQLDLSFGTAEGNLITRGATVWQALPIGAANTVLASSGSDPQWQGLSALFDIIFGSARGSIMFRDAAAWNDLPPGATGQVLQTNGVGANPSWTPRTPEFPSGTVMLFQQSTAPPGWTKQTTINDYGLRVTSGAVGVTPGSAFSTVFAQSVVGNTTIIQSTMPNHSHPFASPQDPLIYNGNASQNAAGGSDFPRAAFGGHNTSTTGGDGPHAHSINLTLSYVDVIIASKQ